MTPDEWKTIVHTIHANWGKPPTWDNAADLAPDVAQIPLPHMRSVLQTIRNEGPSWAPAPAELIGRTLQRYGHTQHQQPALAEPPWKPPNAERVRAIINAAKQSVGIIE
jgi:hypothetical protein